MATEDWPVRPKGELKVIKVDGSRPYSFANEDDEEFNHGKD
jgi:hypothetical protein